MRRFTIVILVLLVVLGLAGIVAKRVLIDNAPVPPRSRQEIDLGQLRGLARSLDGALPLRINSELVGEHTVPSSAVVAGTGFGPHPMVRTAFQVVYANRSILIDTTMDRALSDEFSPDGTFMPDQFQSVLDAMRRADTILVTHEHADHIGGISKTDAPEEVWPRVLLTTEQAANTKQLENAQMPEGAVEKMRILEYDDVAAVAPGLVVIKAPGHTPGSQMIYVLLQDDQEFLFVGDIIWDMDNISKLTGRPRLVTDWFIEEDREVVLEQIRMLHDFTRRHPDVRLVVAHDAGQYRAYTSSGLISPQFE